MNRRITNPLIVHFIADTPERAPITKGRTVYVPTNVAWADFMKAVPSALNDSDYDSVIVHTDKNIDLDVPGMVNGLNIKLNTINKAATNKDLPVLNNAVNGVWYFLNPPWDEQMEAHGYAPGDDVVLQKYLSYGTAEDWQEHQARVWSRMADMMPLSTQDGWGLANHLAQLTDPKRGLEKEDLSKFWSFKSNKTISPSLMGDDMIGFPSMSGKSYDGFVMVVKNKDGVMEERPLDVKSLTTLGDTGIAIPMENVNGHTSKYQIATDPAAGSVRLKARAADGISIQQSEYYDKNRRLFKFTFEDGTPSGLKATKATTDGTITFTDAKGSFVTHMKADVTETLKERGYALPPLIHKITVEPKAKYIWQSRGTMAGSENVFKTVSPSNAGFVVGREPKNGADDYVVVVVEGALKGRIVAKYADVKDKNGASFGDKIAKDSGILIAQVPGVATAFIETVKPVYDAYNVKGTYVAFDADGQKNRAVANGIATAYDCLSKMGPTKVMSWNPDQKGLDDALLAIAQNKITLPEMGIRFGTAEELYPKAGTRWPNPYRLDGSRALRQEWQIEYTKDSQAANKRIKELQEETKRRAEEAKKAEKKEVSDDKAKKPDGEQKPEGTGKAPDSEGKPGGGKKSHDGQKSGGEGKPGGGKKPGSNEPGINDQAFADGIGGLGGDGGEAL